MATRKHLHEMDLAADPQRVFALLITPSAIRAWWQAARAIVLPRQDGLWVAAWGEREDDPDYMGAYRIRACEPPKRLVLADGCYYARSGPLPFEADFVIQFTVEPRGPVEPRGRGCSLRVEQDGFPTDPVADAFYAACETGWKNTFAGIRKYLGEE